MKGQQKVIDILNKLLISEQTAYVQYRFNACWNKMYGYKQIAEMFFERANDEKHHHHKLMNQILLLEGLPVIDTVDNPKQAVDVRTQFENDYQLELKCIQDYNDAIHLVCCGDENTKPDNDTRALLEHILKEETVHCKEIEAVLKKIDDVGIQNFLTMYPK